MKPLTLLLLALTAFTTSSCTVTAEKWDKAMNSGGSYYYNKTLGTDKFVSVVEEQATTHQKPTTRLRLLGNKYDLVLNHHDSYSILKPVLLSGLEKPIQFSTNKAAQYKYSQTLDDALVISTHEGGLEMYNATSVDFGLTMTYSPTTQAEIDILTQLKFTPIKGSADYSRTEKDVSGWVKTTRNFDIPPEGALKHPIPVEIFERIYKKNPPTASAITKAVLTTPISIIKDIIMFPAYLALSCNFC